jgi:hypothetical protein
MENRGEFGRRFTTHRRLFQGEHEAVRHKRKGESHETRVVSD